MNWLIYIFATLVVLGLSHERNRRLYYDFKKWLKMIREEPSPPTVKVRPKKIDRKKIAVRPHGAGGISLLAFK